MKRKDPVDSFMTEYREIISKAKRRALAEGFEGLSSHEGAAVIANAYFKERSEAVRDWIGRKIDDLVWSVVAPISAAQPGEFRKSLKGVFADLKSVIEACGRAATDAGRPRRITADTLISMTGRLPMALVPPSWEGADFSDFGEFSIKPFRQFQRKNEHNSGSTGKIDSPQSPPKQAKSKPQSFPISRNSLLLPGILQVFSADDLPVEISPRGSAGTWPASVGTLGYANDGNPPVTVTTRNIQALPNDQKEELAKLAEETMESLRWHFGIQHKNDPLNFSEIQLVAPTATAMILSCLTEIICTPWPELIQQKEVLAQLTEPLPGSDEWHSDLQGSLYQAVFKLVKRHAGFNGKVFREKADWIGLFEQGDEDSKFNEHVEGYVQMLAQVRQLHAARIWIEELLSKHDIDLADYVKAVGGRTGISPEDHHDLSRWSESLKKRLQLGAVGDLTKGSTLRFDIGHHQWKFPKFSERLQVEEMTRRLVAVVQKSRSRKLEPHDDGLRKFVSGEPKTLKAILEWYAEKRGVTLGAGAALDRLGRLGLSDRLAKSHGLLTDSSKVSRPRRPDQ